MKNKGYIMLNRRFFDNPLWIEPREYSRAEAWIDLIQSASIEAEQKILDGRAIEMQRGEVTASRRFLEKRWGWGSTKVTNFLKMLQANRMIDVRQTSGQTIITLCNYEIYNNPQTSRRTSDKPPANQSQTKYKEYKNTRTENIISTDVENDSCESNPVELTGGIVRGDWRSDFNVYIDGLRKAYVELINDPGWIGERERFNPNINVPLTLEKACKEFWATPDGWAHKKKQRARTINWRTTLAKACSQPQNRVYHDRRIDKKAAAGGVSDDFKERVLNTLFRGSGTKGM